jgi:hypothetical protein
MSLKAAAGAVLFFVVFLLGSLALIFWLREGGEWRQMAFQATAMRAIGGVVVLVLLYKVFAPKRPVPLVSKMEVARLERERKREAAAAAGGKTEEGPRSESS